MIQSFNCTETEKIFCGEASRKLPTQIQHAARRKLRMLAAAERIDDLRIPPGNRLEALTSSRKGQHSIRVNDQWRICFRWTDHGPEDVEMIDYH